MFLEEREKNEAIQLTKWEVEYPKIPVVLFINLLISPLTKR